MSDLLSELLQKLIADLLAIYTLAGQEVTYVTDKGERRKYWPHRYLQAVRRAIDKNEVLEFVERLVTRGESTRGFGYLQDAGRLDLTVEALVVDEEKPYHHLFSKEAIEASAARLAEAKGVIGRQVEANGRVEFTPKARSILDAIAPHVGVSKATDTEIPVFKGVIAAEAEHLAEFEGHTAVYAPHVLRAAELYVRRHHRHGF
jgi:hypothetical protein